ncbi:MAG: sugar transferase [Chloroflexi bacterium]|nr:sugar transferase [Chloroflexota bacterium]
MVALWIKCDSPGPVFYRGRRMGRGGRKFHILKFRNMYEYPCGARAPSELSGRKSHCPG